MRLLLFMLCCGLVHTAHAQAVPGTGTVQTDSSRDRAREPTPDTGLMYHLTWYGADYAVTAALLGASAGLLPLLDPGAALYGPQFDDGLPDFRGLDDPVNARLVGAPFRDNTVPELWLYIGGGALAASALAYDGIANHDGHRIHNLTLGAIESIALTYALTEALKMGVGRLRPDFRDRAARYYCNPEVGMRDQVEGLDCGTLSEGPYTTAKDLRDGHKSFPSGHSSAAFALATYFALYSGGELVWGAHATSLSMPVGATLMAGLWGLAATVAATRISDGRHNVDDVVAGAALGTAISTLFYFLHFDRAGRATYRGLAVAPAAMQEGVALSLVFPL
ncbi:MAG: phosphatase PAP2 family protein [Pseudomonadota bacterium]